MAALCSRCGHYIFALWFLSIFFFSSPNLSGRTLDVYHTSTHGVGPIANLECRSETCCARLAENARPKKLAISCHHSTTLLGYMFANKVHIDNRGKNLLSSNISSTCPHNLVNFGPLTAEIDWRVWGTPSYFNGYRILATLLPGTVLEGISQTLRQWTEGTTYIRQGDHHVGHWPTFLVISVLFSQCCEVGATVKCINVSVMVVDSKLWALDVVLIVLVGIID